MKPEAYFKDAGLLGALATGIVLGAGVLLHVFSVWFSLIAFAVGGGVVWVRLRRARRQAFPSDGAPAPMLLDRWALVPYVAVLLLQALMLCLLFLSRTDRALASPWLVLPNALFALFGGAVFLLLVLEGRVPRLLLRCAWFGQLFVAFGVSAIVYALGFGFDPFIHQAATRFLLEHGDIRLPSILYVGQYGLEAGLAHLAPFSIGAVDRWLVPALAAGFGALLLPRAWRLWSEASTPAWVLLLLPFLPFTFTVPYHLAYVVFVAGVFFLPYLRTVEGLPLAVGLVMFTGLVHPLLAVPFIGLLAAAWIARRWPRLGGPAAFLGTSFALIAAFYVYVRQQGGVMVWPSLEALHTGWRVVSGFPYPIGSWPRHVLAFYGLVHGWPLVFSAIGWIGYGFLGPDRRPLRAAATGTALAMVVAGLALAASTRFTNILSSEQFEFALRLRYAAPILFFPGVAAFVSRALSRSGERLRLALFLGIALFATAFWYVSYPQANRFVHMSAPGLSRADVDAVDAIERLSEGRPYVVLSSQMVSAAALVRIGFTRELQTAAGPRYPYAIPTGGELYQQYLRLWRDQDVSGIVRASRQFAGAPLVFVTVPRAWDPRGILRARLKHAAQGYEAIDAQMDVYLFVP